jgi:outer membrane protein W
MIKVIIGLVFLSAGVAFCQDTSTSANPDSEYAFMPIKEVAPDTVEKTNALGVDIMLGTNGFGMGFFYKQNLTGTLSWTFSISGSEAKAPNEMDTYYYDPIYGYQKTVLGKVNQLFVFPAMFGMQYRLFKDDLTGSFRPYVCGGVGPNAIFAAPYNQPFSWSMSHGRGYFGAGGYIGIGAYFGMDTGSLMGVNIKYYILPMAHGIESLQNEPMANFNSLFLSLNIATQY